MTEVAVVAAVDVPATVAVVPAIVVTAEIFTVVDEAVAVDVTVAAPVEELVGDVSLREVRELYFDFTSKAFFSAAVRATCLLLSPPSPPTLFPAPNIFLTEAK